MAEHCRRQQSQAQDPGHFLLVSPAQCFISIIRTWTPNQKKRVLNLGKLLICLSSYFELLNAFNPIFYSWRKFECLCSLSFTQGVDSSYLIGRTKFPHTQPTTSTGLMDSFQISAFCPQAAYAQGSIHRYDVQHFLSDWT